MHNRLVKHKMHKVNGTETAWDLAIEDAKEQIDTLKRSIKIFSEAKERGEAWRGSVLPMPQSTNQKEESCHSV